MIDTHCHLYAEQFDADRNEVVQKAIDSGVNIFLLPNIDQESLQPMYQLCDKYPENCLPMMGLHPTSVDADYKKTLDFIYKELGTRKFIGIGEIGLDYYWDTTYKTQQIDAFNTQLRWASELNLPAAIHTRNSFEDAFSCVDKMKSNGLTGVFHCFSGSSEDAQKIISIDFFMGIGGVLTFKNGGLDKVLPGIPLEFLVLETDAPYLAPAPYRGKRNSPEYLHLVAAKMAEILNQSASYILEMTSSNARKLFNI